MVPFLFLLFLAACFAIYAMRRRILSLEDVLQTLETENATIFDFLDRIGSNLTQDIDTTRAMEMVVDFAQEATHSDAACLYVRDHKNPEVMKAHVVRGFFPPMKRAPSEKVFVKRKYMADMVKKIRIPVGEGVIGRIAEDGKPVLVSDVKSDPRFKEILATGVEVRDFLAVPIIIRQEVLGILALVNKKEGGRFGENDQHITMAITDQAAVTLDMVRLYKVQADQQRLEQELELARTFQSLLLPRERPELDKVQISEFYRPALEVGGDYYDYIPIDDEHVGIAVGDVSGKGIPGALVMASVRATLRAEARMSLSPKEVLRKVNEEVAHDTKESVFITMTYGVLNTRSGEFRFCRAGHEPVICCSMQGEDLLTFMPEGIALGLLSGEIFEVTEEATINLAQGEAVVLYTDGVVEAMNGKQEEYGEDRFHQVLRSSESDDPDRMVDRIVTDIEDFTRGLPQHDDITLVIIGWKDGGQTAQIHPIDFKASTA